MSDERIELNGYLLQDNFSHVEGDVQWTYAEKDGKAWFIKRFQDPVFPVDVGRYEEAFLNFKREQCIRFYQQKRRLYDAVNASANGNIVTIEDFFLITAGIMR